VPGHRSAALPPDALDGQQPPAPSVLPRAAGAGWLRLRIGWESATARGSAPGGLGGWGRPRCLPPPSSLPPGLPQQPGAAHAAPGAPGAHRAGGAPPPLVGKAAAAPAAPAALRVGWAPKELPTG